MPEPLLLIIGGAGAISFFIIARALSQRAHAAFKSLKNEPDFTARVLAAVPISPLVKIVTNQAFIEKLAARADWEYLFCPSRVLAYKELSAWAVIMLAVIFYFQGSGSAAVIFFSISALALALGWPELVLARRAYGRERRAIKELPRVIDLLCLYVSAGSHLEAAVSGVASHISGVWRGVFTRAASRLAIGFTLAEALGQTGLPALPDCQRFLLVIRQARILGVSVSATLQAEVELLRVRRRQSAEEAARRASVRVALPLTLCIFPALLIIYLAPAILKIMGSL